MFVFSWTGLGFLAPLLMLVPYTAIYGLVQLGLLPAGRLWPYLIAAVLSFALTYYVGQRWNAEEIRHRFCGIRVERWAYIQLGLACAFYGIFWLGFGSPP